MISGKTKSGFSYSISQERLNNYELLELISKVDNNPLATPDILNLLLGEEQVTKLKNHLRKDTGFIPVDLMLNELEDILKNNQQTKNF